MDKVIWFVFVLISAVGWIVDHSTYPIFAFAMGVWGGAGADFEEYAPMYRWI